MLLQDKKEEETWLIRQKRAEKKPGRKKQEKYVKSCSILNKDVRSA